MTKPHQHLATMAPLSTWLSLLWENGGVAPAYWGKLARILVPTTLAIPLRLAERLRYGRQVARTALDEPPLFILGFARSGTTHLHNLLSHDPQYGAISTFQAAMPTFFLIGRGWLKRLLERSTPDTRPMDDVEVSLDMPQEEEVALVNSCRLSALCHLSFPRQARHYFDKYAMMEGLTKRELALWERCYLDILRKATIDNKGRQLVLKSPSNTGRVPHLLRLFPEAKFIHIVRNPYVVYQSIMHLYRQVLPLYQLQDMAAEDLSSHILYMYQKMMQQYLQDRSLIPPQHLAELSFEDLEQQPLNQVERLYAELSLPGWEQARPHISAYIQTLASYRKNPFAPDAAIVERINREWKFVLDTWGYQPPDSAA